MSDASGFFSKAFASVKVMAKDAVQGTATLVNKVAETDLQGTARRLTNKVMEKADSHFTNVEELPEVESAMLNLKQTDAAYKELLVVLKESFVCQTRASNRQLKAANRANVIGRDLETAALSLCICSFGNHLTVTAERGQELNNIKEAAEIEEKALDDFDKRVYDSPASRLITALETFLNKDLAVAMVARTKYKDTRREVSLDTKKVTELEAKGPAEKVEAAKALVAKGHTQLDADRDELMKQFMLVEQKKPSLQSSVHAYLQSQLQYHQQCVLSSENALAAFENAKK